MGKIKLDKSPMKLKQLHRNCSRSWSAGNLNLTVRLIQSLTCFLSCRMVQSCRLKTVSSCWGRLRLLCVGPTLTNRTVFNPMSFTSNLPWRRPYLRFLVKSFRCPTTRPKLRKERPCLGTCKWNYMPLSAWSTSSVCLRCSPMPKHSLKKW